LHGLPPSLRPAPTPRVVIPVSGVHRGIVEAVDFALAITRDVTAVYIELEPGEAEAVQKKWKRWWPDIPLVVVPSPYRSIIQPLIDFLDETDAKHNDGQLRPSSYQSSSRPNGGRALCITRLPGCSRRPCCIEDEKGASNALLSISPIICENNIQRLCSSAFNRCNNYNSRLPHTDGLPAPLMRTVSGALRREFSFFYTGSVAVSMLLLQSPPQPRQRPAD
jgi:hypothetical protein